MGIKFLCSQCGKKLNVKSFLAGKRGICPHCGAGVDIPGERSRPAMAGAASPSPAPSVASPTVSAAPAMPAADPLPPGVSPLTAAAGVPYSTYSPSGPMPVGPKPGAAPVGPIGPASPASPMMARPGPSPSGHIAIPAGPAMAVPAGPAIAPMPPAAPSAPHPPVPHDPIAEAPNAVWYVRPPSGGQFGPAPGETMRKWIGEGRVTAESLVWREGWADWKKASSVFPQLGAGNEPMVVTGPSASGRTPLVPKTPSGSNSTAIILIVALVVLIIPLAIALVYLVTQGSAGK